MRVAAPTRRTVRAASWRASALHRVLPDFLIVGAQKAGTTSLYDVLSANPQVLPARKKEVRYFDQHWSRGTLWYRWSFPSRLTMAARRGRTLTGEASPDYLVHPLAPGRAASILPTCRLIVLLRHPVDRAHSQYRMNLALGTESRSFDEAIHDELTRLDERRPDDDHWDDRRNYHSYVERSLYHPQLVRWLAHYPRASLHVTSLEAILARPEPELGRINEFLGVGESPTAGAFSHSNRRSYEALPADRRAALFELFAEDVDRTENLLDLDLGYRSGPN